jgi:nucleoside-diphosphate-sugar epimerase
MNNANANAKTWSGRRVFVTGGTGFIGANLVRRLHALGAVPHLLVRENSDWSRLLDLRSVIQSYTGNVCDPRSLQQALREATPEYCFHMASYGSSSWQTDEKIIRSVTCDGIDNLIRACLAVGCGTLVNAGSSSEYGLKDYPPREDEGLEPNSAYAAAKGEATACCQRAARNHGLHAPTARLYSVYGPWESTRRFVPAMLRAALNNTWPPLVNANVARDFVYVDDAIDLLLQMAERTDLPGDAIYNVGTGAQTTIGDAVSLTRDTLDVKEEPKWGTMPDREWDTTCWVSNPEKAKTTFGWQPRDFSTGIRQTIDWLRQHPDWS